jgi:hypothetical protein
LLTSDSDLIPEVILRSALLQCGPPRELGAIAKYWTYEHRRSGEFTPEQAERYARLLRVYENYSELCKFYRGFIRDNCPPR